MLDKQNLSLTEVMWELAKKNHDDHRDLARRGGVGVTQKVTIVDKCGGSLTAQCLLV